MQKDSIQTLLDRLGTWQDEKHSITQELFPEFIELLIKQSSQNHRPADVHTYLRAVAVAMEKLSKEEYFSEQGKKLQLRQFVESLFLALETEVDIGFSDMYDLSNFEIKSIEWVDIYRDGGSLGLIANINQKPSRLELFLQVANHGGYTYLYPCGPDKTKIYEPIVRDSMEDLILLEELQKHEIQNSTNNETSFDPSRLAEFLLAMAKRIN